MGRKKKKKTVNKEIEKEVKQTEEVKQITEEETVILLDDLDQSIVTPPRPKNAPPAKDCVAEYYNAKKKLFIFKLKNHRKVVIPS